MPNVRPIWGPVWTILRGVYPWGLQGQGADAINNILWPICGLIKGASMNKVWPTKGPAPRAVSTRSCKLTSGPTRTQNVGSVPY